MYKLKVHMFQMVQDLGLKIIRLLSEDLITFTVFECLKKVCELNGGLLLRDQNTGVLSSMQVTVYKKLHKTVQLPDICERLFIGFLIWVHFLFTLK